MRYLNYAAQFLFNLTNTLLSSYQDVNKHNKIRFCISYFILFTLIPCTSFAAEEEDHVHTPRQALNTQIYQLEEVTVTARKRDERSLDVPFAVSILQPNSKDTAMGANDESGNLARAVPNLSFSDIGGTYNNTFLLRGVGSLQPLAADDSAVAVYENGVPKSIISAPVSLFDVARVEVLKGPQGTLFGRNSQGGAVHVVANLPKFEDSLMVGANAGNLQQKNLYAIANKVFTDDIAARVAVRHAEHNGVIENLANGEKNGQKNNTYVRALTRWFANSHTELNISGWLHKQYSNSPRFILRNNPKFPQVSIDPNNDVNWQDAGARIEARYEFLSGITLTSLSSFEDSHTKQDFDFTDGLLFQKTSSKPMAVFNRPYKDFTHMVHNEQRYQQEFRLSSSHLDDFQWQVGSHFFYSDFQNNSTANAGIHARQFALQNGHQLNDIDTLSGALFSEIDAPLTNTIRFNFGLRATHERKDAHFRFTGNGHPAVVNQFDYKNKIKNTLISGRIGLSSKINSQTLVYINTARGTTAGGYQLYSPNLAKGKAAKPYAASYNWSYVAGTKWRSADNLSHLDFAIFYNSVSNGHLVVFNPSAALLEPATLDYNSYGSELEGQWTIHKNWSLVAGLGYTYARLQNVPENHFSKAKNNNLLANLPAITANSALRYQQPQGWFADITWQHVGKRSADIQNNFNLNSYHLFSSKMGYGKQSWKVFALGRNLTDTQVEVAGQAWRNGVQTVRLGEPRLFALGFEANW